MPSNRMWVRGLSFEEDFPYIIFHFSFAIVWDGSSWVMSQFTPNNLINTEALARWLDRENVLNRFNGFSRSPTTKPLKRLPLEVLVPDHRAETAV